MTDRPALNEFGIIEKYFAPLASDPLSFFLRDDAALIKAKPGHDLVVKTDGLIAGVHFFGDDRPEAIAQKLLRVNLSDLAAKGAEPHGYVITCAFPRDISISWIERFASGLAADQAEFGLSLLGGDTLATPGPLCLSLTAFGYVAEGTMTLRAGATPGDLVFVTGTIGDAVLGLAAIKAEPLGLDGAGEAVLKDRYWRPLPRLAVGQGLRSLASAALDVSDGLVADLGHLAKASEINICLRLCEIPLSEPARHWAKAMSERLLRLATGGDDYEIAFTAPPSAVPRLNALSVETGVTLTPIGEVRAGQGVTVLGFEGALAVQTSGYQHF